MEERVGVGGVAVVVGGSVPVIGEGDAHADGRLRCAASLMGIVPSHVICRMEREGHGVVGRVHGHRRPIFT